MHRLFVALRPPRAIRAMLTAAAGGVPDARWQTDEQLHLTLRYIGDVERPVAEDVAMALAGLAAPAPTIAIAGVGRFEKRGRTDALWAGVTPHAALVALHRKIDQALIRIGLEPEHRRYLPHITLARLARGGDAGIAIERWLADQARLTSAAFTCDHLILYESHLEREGARYEPVYRWRLD